MSDIREKFGVNYLLKEEKSSVCKHKFESETFYLARRRYGNRSWNERDTTEILGRRVKVCALCKGVFSE